MGLARWKRKFDKAKKATVEGVSGAVRKASSMLDTTITFESAQQELAEDLEKGLGIFDEIGLPQDVGDAIQEDIADYAMQKLKDNFPKQETKV